MKHLSYVKSDDPTPSWLQLANGKLMHTWRQCLLKIEFCFLKSNILVKHYCVEREPLRDPRGLRKDSFFFPTSKNHATIPCKGVILCCYHFRAKRGNAELSYLQLASFAVGVGSFIKVNVCRQRHLTVWRGIFGAGILGPAPAPWESLSTWRTRGRVWSTERGASRVHWPRGCEKRPCPGSLLFPLESVFWEGPFPEVGA